MTETYTATVVPEWVTSVGQASLSEQVRRLEAKNAELLATIEQRDKALVEMHQEHAQRLRIFQRVRAKLIDELAGHMDNAKAFQRSAEYWHARAARAERNTPAMREALAAAKVFLGRHKVVLCHISEVLRAETNNVVSLIDRALSPDKPVSPPAEKSARAESPLYGGIAANTGGGIDPAELGCGGSGSGWCDCQAGED
jgi:uncharacterized protein YyaL (SSP411 family)